MCNHILPELMAKDKDSAAKKTKHSLILHFDNAKPHTSKMTTQKISELQWTKLDQPPYSPDISPNDFFLYVYIKSKLQGYHPLSRYDLFNAIKEICEKKSSQIFGKMCIDHGSSTYKLYMIANLNVSYHIKIIYKSIAYSLSVSIS